MVELEWSNTVRAEAGVVPPLSKVPGGSRYSSEPLLYSGMARAGRCHVQTRSHPAGREAPALSRPIVNTASDLTPSDLTPLPPLLPLPQQAAQDSRSLQPPGVYWFWGRKCMLLSLGMFLRPPVAGLCSGTEALASWCPLPMLAGFYQSPHLDPGPLSAGESEAGFMLAEAP